MHVWMEKGVGNNTHWITPNAFIPVWQALYSLMPSVCQTPFVTDQWHSHSFRECATVNAFLLPLLKHTESCLQGRRNSACHVMYFSGHGTLDAWERRGISKAAVILKSPLYKLKCINGPTFLPTQPVFHLFNHLTSRLSDLVNYTLPFLTLPTFYFRGFEQRFGIW